MVYGANDGKKATLARFTVTTTTTTTATTATTIVAVTTKRN